jgi:hypothetical protein
VIEAEALAVFARLRGFAASARHPSHGSPSRSSRFGVRSRERRMVDLIFSSSNRLIGWLRSVDALKSAA